MRSHVQADTSASSKLDEKKERNLRTPLYTIGHDDARAFLGALDVERSYDPGQVIMYLRHTASTWLLSHDRVSMAVNGHHLCKVSPPF